MARGTRGLALALAGLFVLTVLLSAPARLLGLLVPSQQVVLQGFSGSLWQGRVSRCVVNTPAGYLHLGELRWSLPPWSLLLLSPQLDFESRWGAQRVQGEVRLRGGRDIALTDLEAQLPADLLRQLAPVAVEGSFAIEAPELRLRDGLPVTAQGRIVWRASRWLSPQGEVPLGDYALDFSQAEDGPLEGQVSTLAGPISAAGQASLALADGAPHYRVDVVITSEQDMPDSLRNALSLLARPEGRGFRLQLDGSL